MGHHLFVNGKAVLPMRDGDLELVRHFLIQAATEMGDDDARATVLGWRWECPGVWTEVETEALQRRPEIFEAAVAILRTFGRRVPVDYLEGELEKFGTQWTGAQDVDAIVRDLQSLRRHVIGAGG